MEPKIFVNHAHVFPEAVRPDGTVDRLRQLMETCEIDEAICFAPFSYQLSGTDIRANTWLAEEIAAHPNLYGFGTLDLERKDLKDQVKHIHDLGFKGIKLHPAAQKFNIVSEAAFVAYEAAQELNLFLSFHTGIHWHRIKDYDVVLFDEIAYHFPELKFSMEHVGGYHFFADALAVIINNLDHSVRPVPRSNVFAGLTSVFTRETNRHWYLSKDRLEELIAQAGADQLIFGLDFPYNLEEETRTGLDTLADLHLTVEERSKVLGGNLRRELGL